MKIDRKNYYGLIAFTIMIVICFNVAYATETRVSAMGGVGFYTKDNSNIFLFPGTIYSYSHQVIGELREKNQDKSYTIGFHLPFGSSSVLGAYLNNPVSLYIPSQVQSEFIHVTIEKTMDFFYGAELSNFDLGLRLLMSMDSYSDEDIPDSIIVETTESANYFGFGAGLSNENMDLGFIFELPGVKYECENEEKTWGGIGIGLNGRLFTEFNDFTLIPVATFKISPTKYEHDTGISGQPTIEVNYNLLKLGIGVGLNYELNQNNLFVLGIEPFGLSTKSEDIEDGTETKETTIVFPGIYAGVESQIKPWLVGRFGAAQVYKSITTSIKPYQGQEEKTKTVSKDFALTFGLGFNFGRFSVDAYINEGLFFDGPNIISGTSQTMASKLSVTYNFE